MIINRVQSNIISKFWLQIDKVILSCILLLLVIGFILIISASPFIAIRIGITTTHFIYNHCINVCIGIFTMIIISLLDKKYVFQYFIYIMIFFLLLMAILLFCGSEVKGAKRWFYIGKMSLQPSEFAKVLYPICLVYLLEFSRIKRISKGLKYITLTMFHTFFVILLLLEPDVGTTVLVSLIFLCLLIVDKIGVIWIILMSFIGTLLILSSYFIFPHVNYRINEFLTKQRSYQSEKAIEAVERGKIFGIGVGQGKIKQYIPDAHTDFIFTIASEEFGIISNYIIILLYLIIIFRSLSIVIVHKNIPVILATLGCCLIIAFQSFIHIASNISLIPTKGMTLPLISYGGSSFVATSILMGCILCFTKRNIQNVILRVK